MSDSETREKNHAQLDTLLPKVVEGSLSEHESRQLVDLLRGSRELQAHYLGYVQIHAELGSIWGAENDDSILADTSAKMPVTPASAGQASFYLKSMAASALAIACGLAIAVVMLLVDRRPSEGPLPAFIEHVTGARVTDVAVVVQVDAVAHRVTGWAAGRRLKPGTLRLDEGRIQIEFMSGAVVALAGPAELQLGSQAVATLVSGNARAHVPPRARGFVLNTPDAAIYDLGTEFVVNVSPAGVSEVEVVSGEVELSLIGDDGNTLTSEWITETGRVRVDRDDQSLTPVKATGAAELLTIQDPDEAGLVVPSQYVQSVLESRPVAYWRFDSATESSVFNEVAVEHSLVIQKQEAEADCLRLVNGHVQFRRGELPRSLVSAEPFLQFNQGVYAIESWIKPNDLQHASWLGVFPIESPSAFEQLNVLEIVTNTTMIHDPGAIRFLHRTPPGRSAENGINAFSPGLCVPGLWHHVVTMKTADAIEIYVNGKRIRRVETKAHQRNCDGSFRVNLGQLGLTTNWRQFAGAMDEVAIYRRNLKPAEIAEHYDLMMSVNR
ncbi:FecR family protein [Neorhodopirellula lusitana]|uniref:FecR family protein n=1 Tax=Neorhodopirellula lusitana TaxID=445327 RepID=A0ABY1QP23_9BACT|nr:LamG-like jellyroll fold domain-containing protein [Neorhodopirellula lusitana]SMP74824.1 FecR family protein [Neorhodopirellula lusitana]